MYNAVDEFQIKVFVCLKYVITKKKPTLNELNITSLNIRTENKSLLTVRYLPNILLNNSIANVPTRNVFLKAVAAVDYI